MGNITRVGDVNNFGGACIITPSLGQLRRLRVPLSSLRATLARGGRGHNTNCVRGGKRRLAIHIPNALGAVRSVRGVDVTGGGNCPVQITSITGISVNRSLEAKTTACGNRRAMLNVTVVVVKRGDHAITRTVSRGIRSVRRSLPGNIIVRAICSHARLISQTVGAIRGGLVRNTVLIVIVLFLFLNGFHTTLVATYIVPLSVLFALAKVTRRGVDTGLVDLKTLSFNVVVSNTIIVMRGYVHQLTRTRGLGNNLLDHSREFGRIFLTTGRTHHPLVFKRLVVLIICLPVFALANMRTGLFRPVTVAIMLTLVKTVVLSIAFIPTTITLFIAKRIGRARDH